MKSRKRQIVSVVIPTYNDGLYIRKCIAAVLSQTHRDFELVVYDDGSTDNTSSYLRALHDKRLKYVRSEKNSGSIAAARNKALKHASHELVFITDGDCRPAHDWLEKGLQAFNDHPDAVGIEGRVVYVHEGFPQTFCERVIENNTGSFYMTANIAYRLSILRKYQFNPKYDGLEDRAVGLQIRREGPIFFQREMVVFHQHKPWTVASYVADSQRVIGKVRLIHDFNDRYQNRMRVLYPLRLLLIIFPPLLVGPILIGRVRSWEDLRLLPFAWVKAVYTRYLIWRTAIEERFLLL